MPQIEQEIKEIKLTRYSQCSDCPALTEALRKDKIKLEERINREVKPPDTTTDLEIFGHCEPSVEARAGLSSIVTINTRYAFQVRGRRLTGTGFSPETSSDTNCPGIIVAKELLGKG